MERVSPLTIPLVDFGPVLHNPNDTTKWGQTVQQVDDALSTIGFVYLKNHGIPIHVLDDAFSVARTFFQLPADTKALYLKRNAGRGDVGVTPADNNGYLPAGSELLDKSSLHEIRESFDILGALEGRVYPSSVHAPNFQQIIQDLSSHFVELSLKLSQVLALGLLQPNNVNFFKDRLRGLKDQSVPGISQLRLLYYPEINVDGTASVGGAGITRCYEHSDYAMFTFLAQDGVGGLEVKNVDGKWVQAPPVEGTVLLNTGDLLEFWSGGHYPATKHRVQIPPETLQGKVNAPARQSIAFFVNVDDHVNVAPLKTKYSSNASDVLEFPEVNAYTYVMDKLKNIYKTPVA